MSERIHQFRESSMSNVSKTTTAGRVRTEERILAINRAHPWMYRGKFGFNTRTLLYSLIPGIKRNNL